MRVRPSNEPKRIEKIKRFLKTYRLSVALITGATLVAVIFIIAILGVKNSLNTRLSELKLRQNYYSQLDGVRVDSEEKATAPVTGVMIENSPYSRPQSGLKKAKVVYETLAEGGVTRFLSLYQNEKPEKIGPVRSLRLYYLDWAAPYQASIAHVGGSPNALKKARNGQYRDIDQFFNADSYWRDGSRHAPHNVYTSGERLDKLNEAKDYKKSEFVSFARQNPKAVDEPNATNIKVNFSSDLYNTNYAYNKEKNNYTRYMAGEPHKDQEDGQISPKVVVVIKVTTESRSGDSGYEDVVTTGNGEAKIFQNGTVIEATWRKNTDKTPLQLLDSEGQPIKLVRGQTWISAITGRGSVSWQ